VRINVRIQIREAERIRALKAIRRKKKSALNIVVLRNLKVVLTCASTTQIYSIVYIEALQIRIMHKECDYVAVLTSHKGKVH